jgi:UPF0176 protein
MASKKLFNTIDSRVLRKKAAENTLPYVTVSFYKYFHIADPESFRNTLFESWDQLQILGRTYVAQEGINAQIAVPQSHYKTFVDQLYDIPDLKGVRLNTAIESGALAFFKLIIRVKKKIVADGIVDPHFNPSNTGIHLNAEDFNQITSRPDTVLVDMRNHYESEVGHFRGAILPDADSFREEIHLVEKMLDDQRDKHIVMYCTGGIRCEKASAYLRHKGFRNVYQLEGGIIKYTKDVRAGGLENKFMGVNFVFDERLAERVSDDVIANCHTCDTPYDVHTNCANPCCHILFIQCDACRKKYHNCCSEECMKVAALPEEEQRILRKGKTPARNVFRKGRFEE